MWKLRVPASSANLGSGFDILGCAISLYATFMFEESTETRLLGFDESIEAKDNLFLKAYEKTCLKESYAAKKLKVRFESDIPMSRGLGSSSSLIVAGVCAAHILHSGKLDTEKALAMATEIEGHSDNVAASLLGGLISTKFENGQWLITKHPIHPSLKWTFLIPDFELLTSLSRSVLPSSYPQETLDLAKDKLEKLLVGLEKGDMTMIQYGCDDVLHQPYRFKLIHDFSLIQKQIPSNAALYLSGAGPTLAIISKEMIQLDLSACQAKWQALKLKMDTQGVLFEHV